MIFRDKLIATVSNFSTVVFRKWRGDIAGGSLAGRPILHSNTPVWWNELCGGSSVSQRGKHGCPPQSHTGMFLNLNVHTSSSLSTRFSTAESNKELNLDLYNWFESLFQCGAGLYFILLNKQIYSLILFWWFMFCDDACFHRVLRKITWNQKWCGENTKTFPNFFLDYSLFYFFSLSGSVSFCFILFFFCCWEV